MLFCAAYLVLLAVHAELVGRSDFWRNKQSLVVTAVSQVIAEYTVLEYPPGASLRLYMRLHPRTL